MARQHDQGPDGPKHSWPRQRGFDRHFGILGGAANYWQPNTLTRDNDAVDLKGLPQDFFLADAISDEAAGYYQSYGIAWANLSNTPFREYKHWMHEGGIATPLIAHWPAVIDDVGALRHGPGQLTDIMATCLDVAGADYPTRFNGNDIVPLEGTRLAPIFHDRPNHKEALIWEHEGNRAVRRGRWKLVRKYPGEWELYDIVANRTETQDLAARHPDIVEELGAVFDAWAERCGVKPWDDISERLRVVRERRGNPSARA